MWGVGVWEMWAVGECSQNSLFDKGPELVLIIPFIRLENHCSTMQNWIVQGGWVSCVPLCGEGRQLRRQLWALLTMSFMYKLAHFTFSTPGNIGFLFMKSRFSLLSPHITLLSSLDIFLGFPANNTDNFQIWDLGDSYSTSGRILSEYQVKPRTLSLHEPGLQG